MIPPPVHAPLSSPPLSLIWIIAMDAHSTLSSFHFSWPTFLFLMLVMFSFLSLKKREKKSVWLSSLLPSDICSNVSLPERPFLTPLHKTTPYLLLVLFSYFAKVSLVAFFIFCILLKNSFIYLIFVCHTFMRVNLWVFLLRFLGHSLAHSRCSMHS